MVQRFALIQQASLVDTWLTIGTYDGVHIGHQEIVHNLASGARAAGALAVVITFHPHPITVIRQQSSPHLLSMPDERVEYLSEAGADVVITHVFDHQVAGTTAVDFLNLCKKHLGFRHLWVGYDFVLGHNREGDIQRLHELRDEFDYELQVVPPVKINGHIVSSSRIRGLLREGQVAEAAQALGRWYRVIGEVIEGEGRGRTLGIPTANLLIPAEKMLPEPGVYACMAEIGNMQYPAAVNVGYRPTFDGSTAQPLVEAHLLDFKGDVYGQQLALQFINRLRREQRFNNAQALIEQIHKDISQTRELVAPRLVK